MKFVHFEKPGGPEVLYLSHGTTPEPKAGEVLIEVYAAGINRPDVMQRQGFYPAPSGASAILGLEVSGKIAKCGEGVTRWKAGDPVCALLTGGGYSEYAVASEDLCLPVPDKFSFEEAAALPETFYTVWTNLFEDGHLQKDETVIIHGGSGGIGTAAIQMAHVFGAKVMTTVGKKESVILCKKLGADKVVLYNEEDFVIAAKEFTQNSGVNVILDMVGGDYFERNIEALSHRGRLIQIATLKGNAVSLDLSKMMSKRLVLTGSTLRRRPVSEKAQIARGLERNIWPLLNRGRIKPIIIKIFSLEEAAAAHAFMESSQHTGKIVLSVRDMHR
jgi:NADPH2:quinone reductase